MVTDEERREVAQRLRECRGGWSSGECYYAIIHALGLPDTSRDDGGRALYAALADLIEPEKIGLSSLSGVCPKCGGSTYIVFDDYDWWVITCDICGAKKGFAPCDYIQYGDIESKWKEGANADEGR